MHTAQRWLFLAILDAQSSHSAPVSLSVSLEPLLLA